MDRRKTTGAAMVAVGGLIDIANWYPTSHAAIEGLKKAGGTGGALAGVFLDPIFGLVVVVVGFSGLFLWNKPSAALPHEAGQTNNHADAFDDAQALAGSG